MPVIYPATRGFSLAWLLQFTKSFACLVCRHQFAFSFAFEMSRFYPRFSPKKFTRSSSGTPNKAINAANQFCLVCDCDLRQKAEVVVYFNVRSCPGLQRVIGRDVKPKESHRICRKCKQKIDGAIKKVEAADRVFN